MTHPLQRLLTPRSVAVVGASPTPGNIGARAVALLDQYGFHGPVYPVHPRQVDVEGRAALGSVRALAESIDLAVIAVSAARVPAAVAECGEVGIPFAVVLSGGFAEVGAEGRRLEAQLLETARRAGVRLVGPNTLGFLNATAGIPAGFGIGIPGKSAPRAGSLAIVSQSGGMGLGLLNRATEAGLGVSKFVATGNEADLTLVDFLAYLVEDSDTSVIMVYAETIRDAKRLVPIGRRAAELGKPILVAKLGRTGAGGAAVRSHTGALAGADAVYDAAFREAGMVRVDDLEELFDVAMFLGRRRVPAGDRVAVVTQSGGGGVWLADSLEREGLVVSPPPADVRDALRGMLPPFASTGNPVDLTASGISVDTFAEVIGALAGSGAYDALVVVMPLLDVEPAVLDVLAARTPLPLLGFTHWLPDEGLRAQLGSLAVPYVTSPCRAAKVLAAAVRLGRLHRTAVSRTAVSRTAVTRADGRHGTPATLPIDGEADALDLLRRAGLPVARAAVATCAPQAAAAADRIGYPVALKLSIDGLLHKSDVGGVKLALADTDAVRSAFDQLAAVAVTLGQPAAVLVQEMVPGGVEVIVGTRVDPTFGPVVMVGVGGIYAELLDDVAVRLAPVGRDEAREMVGELRMAGVLLGARGRPPADVDALCAVVERLSGLAVAWQESVQDVDLNPVVVLGPGQGVRLVDAVLVRAGREGGAEE